MQGWQLVDSSPFILCCITDYTCLQAVYTDLIKVTLQPLTVHVVMFLCESPQFSKVALCLKHITQMKLNVTVILNILNIMYDNYTSRRNNRSTYPRCAVSPIPPNSQIHYIMYTT